MPLLTKLKFSVHLFIFFSHYFFPIYFLAVASGVKKDLVLTKMTPGEVLNICFEVRTIIFGIMCIIICILIHIFAWNLKLFGYDTEFLLLLSVYD